MKAFLVALTLAAVSAAVALPAAQKKQLSKQEQLRASLITKDNVHEYYQRQQKSEKVRRLPEPFVVSTQLNVGRPSRQSRTYFDEDGTPVIEGIRMPDDDSDRTVWRNGRVINNIFVPAEAIEPQSVNVEMRQPKELLSDVNAAQPAAPEQPQLKRQPKTFNFDDFYRGRKRLLSDNMAIESRRDHVYVEPPQHFKESRDYKYHAGSTEEGRPVYYVVEEPDSLHSDRSPYDFEPADTHTSLSSTVSDYTQSGLTHATSGDFVIKEHTYSMCAGCPTFSIPVPIPKAIAGVSDKPIDYQHARNRTFLEKIGDRIINGFQKVQSKVLEVIDPILETGESFLGIEDDQNALVEEKIDKNHAHAAESGTEKYMPLAIASMAAMAIGGMALFASSAPAYQFINEAKSFDDSEEIVKRSIRKYEN